MPRDDAAAAQLSFLPGARPAGRYDTATDDEAAAIGRALVAELRGDDLTASQRALLSSTRAQAPAEERAPGPVLDADQLLLALGRGPDAEVRVRWRRYRGSAHFLDIRRFERGDGGGDLRPTRQGVTVRGHEVGKLLSALVKLEAGREADG